MAKKPKPKKIDYEQLAATYQVAEIALLNSVLKGCGITNKRKRRKICEEFIFSQGVVLDEGAFQEGDKWHAPVLGFAELQGDPDKGFRKTKTFYELSTNFPGYHEYAFGNMDHFFDKCKEKAGFDWGPEYDG